MLICKLYRHNCTFAVIYPKRRKSHLQMPSYMYIHTTKPVKSSMKLLKNWFDLQSWKEKKKRLYTTLLATTPHCMVPYYLYFRKSDGWGIYAPCFSSGDGNNATEIPTSFSLLRRDLNLRCLGAVSASSNSSASSKSLTGVVRRVVFEGGVLKAKWIFSAISACDKKRV